MQLQTLKVSECYESETNPRGKDFAGKQFDELVASIKEKGVLVPVLARPRPKDGKKFEVVAGNRRLRAALKAGLTEIPAQVQQLGDNASREAQIVENLQREDIHPLEEGEAYRKLMLEDEAYDVEAVAAKVGKSKTYVRDRLVLTNLNDKAAAEFRKGTFTAGHASLIARLDEKLQKAAVHYLVEESEYNPVPTMAELRDWIQREQLKISATNPPWKGDDEMTAMLGGCDECKGKGGDLFGKKAADICTNPLCYANRITAYIAVQKKKDPELVSLASNYGAEGEGVVGGGKYRELTAKKDTCKSEKKGIFVEGSAMGRTARICMDPDCKKHWADQKPAGHRKLSEEEKEERRKRKEQEVKDKEKAERDLATALGRVKWPMSEGQLGALLGILITNVHSDVCKQACARRAIEVPEEKNHFMVDYDGALEKAVKKMTKTERLQLAFELLINAHVFELDLKEVYKSL